MLELKLLPFHHHGNYSTVVLPADVVDDRVLHRLRNLHTVPVDDDFASYLSDDENGFGLTLRDACGDPLTWTTADALLDSGLTGPTRAYLCALPPECRVALFWC